jgi:hypothetical protein
MIQQASLVRGRRLFRQLMEVNMTIYEISIYEVSIPNPNDAPAALASLVASDLSAEMLVPGSPRGSK